MGAIYYNCAIWAIMEIGNKECGNYWYILGVEVDLDYFEQIVENSALSIFSRNVLLGFIRKLIIRNWIRKAKA